MIIDAHHHLWRYNPEEYRWIGADMVALQRDFLPADLQRVIRAAGVDGTVAVQARQTVEETRWLLHVAEQHPFIKGVVGWVDLLSPQVREQLEEFAGNPHLCGVRHVLQDEADDRFVLRPDFVRGIGALSAYELAYDLLIMPRHLPFACELVRTFPTQRFIVDHIAKPPISTGEISPWDVELRRLAAFPNVTCKLSGMFTQANWDTWQPADIHPYLDIVLETFGPERLMVASDWPVCTVAGRYLELMQVTIDYVKSHLSGAEQAAVLAGNAIQTYRLRL